MKPKQIYETETETENERETFASLTMLICYELLH